MYQGKSLSVIIAAGGSGKRLGEAVPKQFLKIQGKTILEKSIEPFQKSVLVDEIILVVPEDNVIEAKKIGAKFSKIINIVLGGAERQVSVKNGLDVVNTDLVLIHDGARPFVVESVIERVVLGAFLYKAVVPVVPVKDTIRQGDFDESITLKREALWAVQTPQGFNTELIKEAHSFAENSGFQGTDDASLVENLGFNITLVDGDFGNIKITVKEDLQREVPMTFRVGSGYDVHKLVEDRELWICGVKIPYEKGLLGHSDADVGLHALMDALLGAAALGDIGRHFPDTESKYRGVRSTLLLETVRAMLFDEGWKIGNVDVTLICQEPKFKSHIERMREVIAEILETDISQVNVKATTTEKLGFTGRGEGIAAEACATIFK